MSVESQSNKIQYQGDGQASVFPVPFPVADGDHLHLYLWRDNHQTDMLDGYQVIGAGTDHVSVITDAPVESGTLLTILRLVPYTQPMDLVNGGSFNAETLEGSDDNLEMQIQQIVERVNRAVVAPESMNEGEVTYETLVQILEDAEAAAEKSELNSAASAEAARSSASAAALSASSANQNALIASASAVSAAESARSAREDAEALAGSMEEVEAVFSALEPGLWAATLGSLEGAAAAVVNCRTGTRVISKIY